MNVIQPENPELRSDARSIGGSDEGRRRQLRDASSEHQRRDDVRAVIFDGDDTLWRTEGLYDSARSAARAVVERHGFSGARWEMLQRQRDLVNVETLGHDPIRFPTSCAEALDRVSEELGRIADTEVREEVIIAASGVFDAVAPVQPAALNVLQELRRRKIKLALLTKGHPDIQRRRLRQSGLEDLFDLVEVVASKTSGDFLAILQALNLEPWQVISVGNSMRSDVMPSMSAGIEAVWIPAYVWEFERSNETDCPDGIRHATDLSDVLGMTSPSGSDSD